MYSLIIPAYCTNGYLRGLTYDCIMSLDLKRIEPKILEVIIIDNASTPALDIPGVWTLRNEENTGYAGAVNRGLGEATHDKIVVANNDMTFPDGWMRGLNDVFSAGYDVAVLSTSDEPGDNQTGITPHHRMTSFWAIRRHVYEAVGELDTQFTGGAFADTDYCRRIREAGFKIGKNWDVVVNHVGSATFRHHNTGYGENILKYSEKWGNLD